MVLNYAALSGGKVPVTAPIVSTEGAIAATIAVLSGEAATPLLGAMLVLVAVGVFVVALQPGGGADALSGSGRALRRLRGRRGAHLRRWASTPPGAPARACRPAGSWRPAASSACVFLTLPLVADAPAALPARPAARSSSSPAWPRWPASTRYAWGARESIAVTAVLSSQFAVMAALIAHAMGERISPRQWLGVGAVTVGVVVITVTRL